MLTDLGTEDLTIVLLRIQESGVAPTLVAVLFVYPFLCLMRLELLDFVTGPDDKMNMLLRGAELDRSRDSAIQMCLGYVLTVVPESLWLDLSFAMPFDGVMVIMQFWGFCLGLNTEDLEQTVRIMPIRVFGLKELAVILFRIQAFGLGPALKAVLLVYPCFILLRLTLFILGVETYHKRLDDNTEHHDDIPIIRGPDQPFKQRTFVTHLAHVLLASPESLWLTLSFAVTPASAVGTVLVLGLQVALIVAAVCALPANYTCGLLFDVDEEVVDRLGLYHLNH
ncbi:hypothetical protein LTR27_003403 [Elasticomyces elasticus]|nr:hypothetical protein LTR27_003403 [Elasticomyces elasticus]